MPEAGDLGPLGDLATALGLTDAAGKFRKGWLDDPGAALGEVLSDDEQRSALLAFCDEVLGGGERETDAEGRTWLPLVSDEEAVVLHAVVDDRDAGYVAIGAGLRLAGEDPQAAARLQVPVARVSRNGAPSPGPIFLGQPGARATASISISFAGEPRPGEAHLGGLEIGFEVPTATDDPQEPAVSLALLGLQLPGVEAPRDLRISTGSPSELDDALLELVLGLLRNQAAAGGGKAGALARLAGLAGEGAVPPLPAGELAEQGGRRLAAWLHATLAAPESRREWLAALAELLGGELPAGEEELRLSVGAAEVRGGIEVSTDAGGQPLLVPRLALQVAEGEARAVLRADLLALSPASGAARALPALSAYAQLGGDEGGKPLLDGDPGVGSLRAGIEIDAQRQAAILLAAERVTVAGASFATLDLTSPEAVVEAAGSSLGTVAAGLLEGAGEAAAALGRLLGLAPPKGHQSVPAIDPVRLFENPVAALREHWRSLVEDEQTAIPSLLEDARGLLAGAGASAAKAAGAGTAADPWRVALRETTELRAVRDPAGALTLSLGIASEVEDLGSGRAAISADLALAIAHLDLAAGSAEFLATAELALGARSKRPASATIALAGAKLSAERLGLRAAWTAAAGLEVALDAPNPSLQAGGAKKAVDLADRETLERIAGLLAGLEDGAWPAEAATALGWAAEAGKARLSLEKLIEDPRAALVDWLTAALAEREARALSAAAAALARVLDLSADRSAAVEGTGKPDDPFVLRLSGEAAGVAPIAWVEPQEKPKQLRLGLRLPVDAGEGALLAPGRLDLALAAIDLSGAEPAILVDRHLTAVLDLSREGAPLVSEGETELRSVRAEVRLPLDGGGAAASLELVDAAVFGVRRERWPVGAEDPALPEVRTMLSAALRRLAKAPVGGLLAGLGLLADGGLDGDALDELLHDPAGLLAASLDSRREDLQEAADRLLGGLPGVAVDLEARRLSVELGGEDGPLSWSARLEVGGDGAASATATVGSPGTGAAGGFELRFASDPVVCTALRHLPGGRAREIRVWPNPDGDALARLLPKAVLAAIARRGLEEARRLDAQAKPALDAALGAAGLLDGDRVPLPLGLLDDAGGWLAHPAALGGNSLDPAKLGDLLDALKPLLGATGPASKLEPAPGLTIEAGKSDGVPRVGISLDSDALLPKAGKGERPVLTASGGIVLAAESHAELSLSAALPGLGTAAAQANGDISVVLRRKGLPDLPLYPTSPGLGDLADAGVESVLPRVLDALADPAAKGAGERAGALVGALGDLLDLRPGGSFDRARIAALAADPAAALRARLEAAGASGLDEVAAAFDAALPKSATVAVAGGRLRLELAQATIELRPKPFELAVAGEFTGIEAIESASLDLRLDEDGLAELSASAGPGAIDAGGATLRPLATLAAGSSPPGGRRVEIGLGDGEDGSLRARWDLETGKVVALAMTGDAADAEPAAVAGAALTALAELAAGVALAAEETQSLLGKAVGKATARDLLAGVLLDERDPRRAIAGLFDFEALLARLRRLAVNAGEAEPALRIEGFTVGLATQNGRLGLNLDPGGRVTLLEGEVTVSLEADSRWIEDSPPPGLFLGALSGEEISPAIACGGLGLRFSRPAGPLLDAGVTLGSLALHAYAAVEPGAGGAEVSGGVRIQLDELGIPVSSAGGKQSNPVGRGMLGGAGGKRAPAPAFSPALAVQHRHGEEGATVRLSAGDGAGPWWLPIQSAFGPLYLERAGLGVEAGATGPQRIAVLLDGKVSLLGLSVAVDGLGLGYSVSSESSFADPEAWSVELAGLAIDADLAGVTLVGGLRKVETESAEGKSVEYIGSLTGRFSVYGLSVLGGYGEVLENGRRFSTFFAFGAINAPIGGPPAFFVTGIGGGVGINRGLKVPTDLSRLGDSAFIQALDAGADRSDDPMEDVVRLGNEFPAVEGELWFAAGISFNSFALVEGVAVISVAVGKGLEIALLGLARMALPRPERALVSIELGLVARFSSEEGVLWIQAQLTDNSWLLHRSVRLTGGFAYASWFKGEKAGQFVLTMGGYHPRFPSEGYPQVPRLGFCWQVGSSIVIKGESYFALTSEAIMAGGLLEAAAEFGPAWAKVSFSADGIVYFDPFKFELDVHASISAGITIDVWIGEITISIHIGAGIHLEGPEFHGAASFEVGPAELTVRFGDQTPPDAPTLQWDEFVIKYLEDAGGGVARVLSATTGGGAIPPAPTAGGKEKATADGSLQRPFEVLAEFELTVVSAAPVVSFVFGAEEAEPRTVPHSERLGIAPVGIRELQPKLWLRLEVVELDAAGGTAPGTELIGQLDPQPIGDGRFPIGIWGPARSEDEKQVPSGEMIEAGQGARLAAKAVLRDELPAEVAYERVEINEQKPRHPLPLLDEERSRGDLLRSARPLAQAVPAGVSGRAALGQAREWLAAGGAGRTSVAAYAGERVAPPRLGSLTEGLVGSTLPAAPVAGPVEAAPSPLDTAVRPPRAIAVLGQGRGLGGSRPMAGLTAALAKGEPLALRFGEILVIEMPNARRDIDASAPRPRLRTGGSARIAVLGMGGQLLADTVATELEIPQGAERIAVLNAGAAAEQGGLLGWHTGQQLAYVGWGAAPVAGAVLQAPGGGVRLGPRRATAAWIDAPALTAAAPIVETRFNAAPLAVAVGLDQAEAAGEPHFELLVSGASREGKEPIAVETGARIYLVYALKPDAGAEAVTLTAARLPGWSVGAVLASTGAEAKELAAQLPEQAPDALLQPLVAPPADGPLPQLSVAWIAGDEPDPSPSR